MSNGVRKKIAMLKEGKLTKSQKKLVEYFESVDLMKVMYMSITDLAAATDVAEATVLRFCRSLGFSGYQDFRLTLAQTAYEPEDDEPEGGFISELEETYHLALANVKRAMTDDLVASVINLILSARTVSCYGAGHSFLAASEMHYRLMSMGLPTYLEHDAHLANVLISSRGEEDLIILFSVSGSAKDTVEAAQLARAVGMKTIIVTCYEKSPLSRYGDVVIATEPMDSPLQSGSMMGKVMQLFVVDVLCVGMHNADRIRFDNSYAKSSRSTVGKLI